MNRLKDLILELRIELARIRFIRAPKDKQYELMHRYFWLINQRSNSQVKYMEKRFH
jgi:hypothetical protein